MATFQTSLYAAQKPDRVNTSRLLAPNQAGGGVQYAEVAYELDGAEAANDTINLCLLPAGALIIPGLSTVECEVTALTPTPTPTPTP